MSAHRMATLLKPNIAITTSASLPSQPWWPALHKMIIESYKTEQHPAFPPTWTRLNPDPAKGAAGLAQELGDRGHLFVIFSPDEDDSIPVACSGLLPFRGENWIDEVVKPNSSDAEIANGALTESNTDWETCCFCIHPSARGRGLTYLLLDELVAFAKAKGAKRLISNYIAEETGSLWPKLGFEEIPGAGGMMPKGFRSDPEKEGLRAAIHTKQGAKRL